MMKAQGGAGGCQPGRLRGCLMCLTTAGPERSSPEGSRDCLEGIHGHISTRKAEKTVYFSDFLSDVLVSLGANCLVFLPTRSIGLSS